MVQYIKFRNPKVVSNHGMQIKKRLFMIGFEIG